MNHGQLKTSGIPRLDLVIGGGYQAGSRIIVYGSPLSGIDSLASRFADANGGIHLILDEEAQDGMVPAAGLSIEDLAFDIRGDSAIIDSLSTVILNRGIDQAVWLLTIATQVFRSQGGCLLCTMYEGLHPLYEEIRIFRQADVVFHLRSEIHRSQIERSLQIAKYRGMRIPERMIPFIITGDGIELSTTSRVV